jgi:hypothetical protein
MKQTTKPKDTKQSQLRDLARNVAALPLPTPLSGEGGEGGWSRTSSMILEFPQFQEIAARRDEPLPLSLLSASNHQLQISDYKRMI